MKAFKIFVLSVVVGIFTLSTASAITIHDESLDGDLSGSANDPNFGLLKKGVNTILGSISATGDGSDEFDGFRFNIDRDATYTVSLFNEDASTAGIVFFTNQGNAAYAGVTAITAGPLHFYYTGLYNRGNFDYRIDITVPSAVPIPAALPLFGTALGLAGFIGWRRKRKALGVSS